MQEFPTDHGPISNLSDSDSESEVKARERDFHDLRYAAESDPRTGLSGYYSVTREATELYQSLIRKNAPMGATVLEYGCGATGNLEFYKSLNCKLYGIDISPEAIRRAKTTAAAHDFAVSYAVADAEDTKLNSHFFDLVVGSAILHHLNIRRALAELRRVTKPSGVCIFWEPLGHNPLINTFRALTPKLRSPDEHPLRTADFDIMRQHFADVEVYYFNCFSLGAVAFRATRFFEPARRGLSKLDAYMVKKFQWFRKHCWICVIRLSHPLNAE